MIAVHALAVAALVFALHATPTAAQGPLIARVTHYGWTGHRMANGQYPFPGAAACSRILPFGTRVRLNDRLTVTCLDRGHLDRELWVDIYADSPEYGRFIAKTFSPYAYAHLLEEDE